MHFDNYFEKVNIPGLEFLLSNCFFMRFKAIKVAKVKREVVAETTN